MYALNTAMVSYILPRGMSVPVCFLRRCHREAWKDVPMISVVYVNQPIWQSAWLIIYKNQLQLPLMIHS